MTKYIETHKENEHIVHSIYRQKYVTTSIINVLTALLKLDNKELSKNVKKATYMDIVLNLDDFNTDMSISIRYDSCVYVNELVLGYKNKNDIIKSLIAEIHDRLFDFNIDCMDSLTNIINKNQI